MKSVNAQVDVAARPHRIHGGFQGSVRLGWSASIVSPQNVGAGRRMRVAAALAVAAMAIAMVMLRFGPASAHEPPSPAGAEDRNNPQENDHPAAGETEGQKMAALRQCLPGKTDEQIIAVLQSHVRSDPPAAGHAPRIGSRGGWSGPPQRDAIEAIEGHGGYATYGWQLDADGKLIKDARPPGTPQLQGVLGKDFFADAVGVRLEPDEGVGVEDAELRELKPSLALASQARVSDTVRLADYRCQHGNRRRTEAT